MELKNKKFVYHRALNSEAAFRAFLALNAASKQTLAAEGDICWAEIDGEFVIYVHHPDIQGKSLSNERVKELLAKDELFTLEKLLTIDSDAHFIFELKTGNGDLSAFLMAFKHLLERFDVQNAIIDAFSSRQLQALKSLMPEIKTSLHTKCVFGSYVLESTFERPFLAIRKMESMGHIDYFTLSYKSTHINLLGLDIDASLRQIYKAGKKLNLGAIKDMAAFKCAVASNAEYIYLRSAEVLENYEAYLQELS